MDSTVGNGPQPPAPSHCWNHQFHHHNLLPHHHHHHHHFYVSPHCPHHRFMHHLNNHSPICPNFAYSFLQSQIPETLVFSGPYPINPLNLQVSQLKEVIFDRTLAKPDEETVVMVDEEVEQQEDEDEEEEDDPVFVLTDEWKEFFAKSEAKRRLAKQQAKKRGKNRMEQ